MVVLVLLGVAFYLFLQSHEYFAEPAGGYNAVTRPDNNSSAWTSKVKANTAFNADVAAYIAALQKFYDSVYKPATSRPTAADVDAFVAIPIPNVDSAALKTIILEAFHIDSGITAAAREEKEVAFKPSAALQPSDGVDEVRVRKEVQVTPADTAGPFDQSPEGVYAPVEQTEPTHPNTCESTSWHKGEFASVENVRVK